MPGHVVSYVSASARCLSLQAGFMHVAATYSHQYISDRFLPDKAIDLIDEAGSRVRLKHAALPEEAREVEKELRKIQVCPSLVAWPSPLAAMICCFQIDFRISVFEVL